MKTVIGLCVVAMLLAGCLPAAKENFSEAAVNKQEGTNTNDSLNKAIQQNRNWALPPVCSSGPPNTNSTPNTGVY